MRHVFFAPLLLIGLAACSDEPEEPKSMTDVEAEAEKLAKRTPGLYRTTTEVLETSVDGLGPEQADRAEGRTKTGQEVSESCLTKEDADKGVKEMLLALSQPDLQAQCDFTEFSVDGDDVNAKISCDGPLGTGGKVAMDGQVKAESLNLNLDMNVNASLMGEFAVKMKIQSERIGPCQGGAAGA